MSLGVLILTIHIPGCTSLKEKRRRIKPLLTRLQREFNISVAEIDHQDIWQSATIACALVSAERKHTYRSLQKVSSWIDRNWPDVSLVDDQIEMI